MWAQRPWSNGPVADEPDRRVWTLLGGIGLCVAFTVLSLPWALYKEATHFAPFTAVFVAPWVEEIGKALGLFFILVRLPRWLSRERALVFGGAAGLTFAAAENLLYLNVYLPAPSFGIVLYRWTACVALHMIATMITAAFVARAAAGPSGQKWEVVFRGLCIAMVLHGLYNAGATAYEMTIRLGGTPDERALAVGRLIAILVAAAVFAVVLAGLLLLFRRDVGHMLRRARRCPHCGLKLLPDSSSARRRCRTVVTVTRRCLPSSP